MVRNVVSPAMNSVRGLVPDLASPNSRSSRLGERSRSVAAPSAMTIPQCFAILAQHSAPLVAAKRGAAALAGRRRGYRRRLVRRADDRPAEPEQWQPTLHAALEGVRHFRNEIGKDRPDLGR